MKTFFVRTLPLIALTALFHTNPLLAQDADSDLLSDSEELALGSNPFDTDSDDDGLLDRVEVYPFEAIAGSFTFEQAIADAKAKGGRLAVIDSPQKLYAIKRGLLTGTLPVPMPNNFDPSVSLTAPLWIGAHDTLSSGRYQWVSANGSLSGPEIGTAAVGDFVPGNATLTNVSNTASFTVGRPVFASGISANTTITAINTSTRTLTLSNPVEAVLTRRVSSIVVTNGGFGYTTPPTVTFTGGGGTGATATATISGGQVTAITVANPGTNFSSAPTVALSGGNGAGATATASLTPIVSANLATITVSSGGAGYTSAPTVGFSGGGGTGATAVATVSGGKVTGITILSPGTGYTSAPTVTLTGGGFTTAATATATIRLSGGRIYSPVPGAYSNWTVDLPVVGTRQAAFLNSGTSFGWNSAQVNTTRGYLLEKTATNPGASDTDGDGYSDYDEIQNGTDPLVRDPFAGVPSLGSGGPIISFTAPGVAGSYEGLIFDPEQGHIARQTLSLNTKGAFSSSLAGLTPSLKGSFKGSFNSEGYYVGAAPAGLPNVVSIKLKLVEQTTGNWIILGNAETSTGQTLGIELRQAQYGKSNPYPVTGRVTMAISTTSSLAQGPRGDATAVGSIDRNGRLALAMNLPDGGTASFSGAILKGDYVALRALSKSRNNSVLLGPVDMDYGTADRDFGGFLRLYSGGARAGGSQYPLGFEQLRSVLGCRYVVPPKGFLPVSGFAPTAFNSLFNMDGGDFGGISE
ncbi:MAG: C-type lectin domain-containing protein, partial [Verrucomicrobiaceae bacterium]